MAPVKPLTTDDFANKPVEAPPTPPTPAPAPTPPPTPEPKPGA